VRVSEQRATFALYFFTRLVFITVVESVYFAVRSDSLCTVDYVSSLKSSCKDCELRSNCEVGSITLRPDQIFEVTDIRQLCYFLNGIELPVYRFQKFVEIKGDCIEK
jgi:hypothetical protein